MLRVQRRVRPLAGLLVLPLCAGLFTAAAAPETPELQAQIVSRDASGVSRGQAAKLYFAHGTVRLETPQAREGYFLTGPGSAVFVQPARRWVMEARQSSLLTQVFVPADPAAPCAAWQAASVTAGAARAAEPWRCEPLSVPAGPESRWQGYRVFAPGQNPTERWVDPRIGFTVRIRLADGGTLSLEQLSLGPQEPSLFVLPEGFTRMEPAALIERLRHSDVWVNPPQ